MSTRLCSTAGCERKIQARELCTTHWSQWYRANRKTPRTCELCGETFQSASTEAKFCSRSCAGKHANSHHADSALWAAYQERVQANKKPTPTPAPKPRADTRGALRKAIEGDDREALFKALKERTVLTPEGCWEWQGKTQEGYGVCRAGGKGHFVHRLMSHAVHDAREDEPVVHHKCANRKCCNPDHIIPVTQRDNVAEMLARNYYEQRIAELEQALREVAPRHEALMHRFKRAG